MIKAILGVVAGLIFGTAGALAYSHYLGDGKLVADLQQQLDAANDKLAKTTQDKQSLSQETSSVSDQIDELQAKNDSLKKQLDELKTATPTATAAAAPALNPMALMGMMGGMMRGGMRGPQRMVLLQTRLHLTPDQAKTIKAAMDADEKARRDAMRQMFQNRGNPNAQPPPVTNTLDQTLATVLTPEQQVAYKQVQTDEQASRADTMATVQVDQMMPLLQLSDSQKDQLYQSIYQNQLAAPDPMTLMGNPNAMATLTTQAQAAQAAMAKVLTPDQMTVYQQAAAAMPQFGGPGGRGQGGPGGGGPGGGNGGGPGGGGPGGDNGPGGGGGPGNAAPAPVATTTTAPTTTTTTTATDGSAAAPAAAATTNADGSAAAPAATTNAAPTPAQ